MYIQSLSGILLYLVAFLIIFSENGIFFLFFLPGDSLLFALGLLANQGSISLGLLIPVLAVAAIVGNIVGYGLGTLFRRGFDRKKYLPKVNPEHLHKAETFYAKHGVLTVFLARFVPVIRTIVPFFAGVVAMKKRMYIIWSIVGGIAWITVVTFAGYFFGKSLNIQHVAYLGIGVVVAAVVATPIFIAIINRFFKKS